MASGAGERGPDRGGTRPRRRCRTESGQHPPVLPLHILLSVHVVPGATHRSVPALQQSLFGETPRHGEPVAQHGWPVCPQAWQVPVKHTSPAVTHAEPCAMHLPAWQHPPLRHVLLAQHCCPEAPQTSQVPALPPPPAMQIVPDVEQSALGRTHLLAAGSQHAPLAEQAAPVEQHTSPDPPHGEQLPP